MTTKARVFFISHETMWNHTDVQNVHDISNHTYLCVFVFMYLYVTRRYILTYKPLTPITLSKTISKRYGIMIITDGVVLYQTR